MTPYSKYCFFLLNIYAQLARLINYITDITHWFRANIQMLTVAKSTPELSFSNRAGQARKRERGNDKSNGLTIFLWPKVKAVFSQLIFCTVINVGHFLPRQLTTARKIKWCCCFLKGKYGDRCCYLSLVLWLFFTEIVLAECIQHCNTIAEHVIISFSNKILLTIKMSSSCTLLNKIRRWKNIFIRAQLYIF